MNWYGRRKGHAMGRMRSEALMRMETFSVNRWVHSWPKKIWLEVGFGFGEHLLTWLDAHQDHAILGSEVFENGLAHFIANLKPEDEHRCAIFPSPVQELLPRLPKEIFEGIIVFFPDPWPKKRHHKRRLVQGETLDTLVSLLKRGGQIRFASDDPDLVDFTLKALDQQPLLTWVSGLRTSQDPWPAWPTDWPTSRYYEKALARGVPCAHSLWIKKEAALFQIPQKRHNHPLMRALDL